MPAHAFGEIIFFENLISHKKDVRIRYTEAAFVGVSGKPDLMELAAGGEATREIARRNGWDA